MKEISISRNEKTTWNEFTTTTNSNVKTTVNKLNNVHKQQLRLCLYQINKIV